MREISRIKRSACAAAYLFSFSLILFVNQPGAFGRFIGHVHKAFWCAVIELAVLIPIHTITYLSNLRPAPRIFQRLQDLVLTTLLSEAICSSTVRWVQLFVAHGSLSPFPASTPSTLDLRMLEVIGALLQGIAFLCIIQIVYDINAVLRTFQDAVEHEAEVVWANIESLDDRLIYVYLAGLIFLYGLVVHMFTTMALYLQRMAVGTWVTAHVNAWNTLPSWPLWILGMCSILILEQIIGQVVKLSIEVLAEEEVRRQRAMGGPLIVDNEDLDEAAERRLADAIEAVDRVEHVEVLLELVNFEPLPEVAVQPADLLEEPPALRAWRQRRRFRETIEFELGNRIKLWFNWVVVECINLLVPRWFAWPAPWRHISLRWICPEFVALWSEDVRADFYAAALTQTPPSVVAILVKNGLLPNREHVDMWREAGLTTDFVLWGEASVGLLEWGALSGTRMILGKVLPTLVRGLEAAFGLCLVVGGIVVIIFIGPERRTSRKKRRPKNKT